MNQGRDKITTGILLAVISAYIVAAVFVLIFFSQPKQTQAAADTCYWVGDTNPAVWNDATHWSNASGGAGSLCDGGTVPGADDTVIFDGGNTNSATVDVAVSLVALNISSGYTGTVTLSPTAGQNLTLSGDLTLAQGTFDANGRDVSCVNMTASGAVTRTLDMGEGTWTVSGSWDSSGTNQTIQPRTSTVDLTETGNLTTKSYQWSPYDFYNLKLAHDTKTTTLLSSVRIGNILYLYSGGTASSPAGYFLYLQKSDGDPITNTGATINAKVAYQPSASLTIAGHTFAGDVRFYPITNDATFTLSSDLTVGGSIYAFNESASKGSNLDMNGHNLSVANIYIGYFDTKYGTVDFSTGTHTITGNVTRGSSATSASNAINFGSANVSVGGNIDFSYIAVTPGTSTVTMNAGDTGNTITSASQHFNNLAFNNAAGGWSFSDAALVDGNFTVVTSETAGNGVNLNNQTIGITGNFTISAGEVTAGSSTITVAGNWDTSGGTFTYNTSTVDLTGSGDLNMTGGQFFYNLKCAHDTKTTTLNNSGSVARVNNILYTYSGGTFTGSDNVYLYKSNGDPFIDTGATISNLIFYMSSQSISVSGHNFSNVYYRSYTNDVTYTLTSNLTVSSGVSIYSNTADKTAILDTGSYNLTVGGSVAIGSTTYSGGINFGNGTHTVAGDLLRAGTSTANTIDFGTSNVSVGGNINFTGITVTPGTSTVTMNAGDTGNTITSASQHFNNLAFSNAAGGWSFSDAALVDGNFTVVNSEIAGNGVNLNNQAIGITGNARMDAGKLTAGSSAVTVGGSWTVNGGTFEKGTSTVTMNAAPPSLDFDGDNDYVNLGDITELNSTANFTISTWVKQDVVPATDYIFIKTVGANDRILINMNGDGRIYVFMNNAGNTYGFLPSYSNYITAGRWHHISAVYDGTGVTNADRLKLYIDGNLIALNYSGTIPATTANLAGVNAYISYTSSAWDGNIQDFRIFNTSLSAPNITTLYQTGGYTTNMVHRYLLREGSGTTATDTGSNAMNGTISGATWGYGGKTIKTNGQAFNNITFNGSGGSWTLQDDLTATNLTSTLGTLVDNGKTVTVNGNISISGTLASTGSWTQGASGNISNPTYANRFRSLTMAGSGVISTMTSGVMVGGNGLTIGPGTLTGGNCTLSIYPSVNNAVTVDNVQLGASPLQFLQIYAVANITQKAITIPDGLTNLIILQNGQSVNLTATGDFNFGNTPVRISIDADVVPATYTNMSASNLICGDLTIGAAGTSTISGFLKLGSGTHTISGNVAIGNANSIRNILDFGTSNTSVGGNINFTGITVTPGTSTVTMNAGDTGNTITSASQHFNNLAFNNAAGGWSFSDAALVDGNFTVVTSETAGNGVNFNNQTIGITGNARMDAGKLTAGSSAITVGGSWTVNGGTFEKGTSTVTMNAASPTLDFDGNNDNVNLGNITELNSTANFTISAWVKQDVVSTTEDYVFIKRIDSSNLIYITSYQGEFWFSVRNANSSYGRLQNYSDYFTAGRWHHITVVYDGAGATNADKIKLYIDGTYVAFTAFSGTIPATTANLSSANAMIGRDVNAWDGGIQDFRIYNASLSAPNITTLYQTGGYNTGMVHRYLLREGSGTTATDTGSNVMNGTISGATWGYGGKTVKTNGQAFNNITFNGAGGTWTSQDNLTATGDLTLTQGTFDANGFNVNCVNMTASGALTRTLDYGEGTWTVSGNWDSSGTNQTMTPRTSTVILSGSGTITTNNNAFSTQFYNLQCAATGTTTTIAASSGFDVSSFLTLGTGNLNLSNNTINLSKSNGTPLINAGATMTGTVNSAQIGYWGGGTVTITGGNYGQAGISIRGSGATYNLGGNITGASRLYIYGVTGTAAIVNTQNFGLVTDRIHFYAGVASYGGITLSLGSSVVDIGTEGLTMTGDATVTSSILNLDSATVTCAGPWTLASGGHAITQNSGTSTVIMDAADTSGNTITSAGQHFNNLAFSNAAGGWSFSDAALVDGNFTVVTSETAGNGVNLNNQTIGITGNARMDAGKLTAGSSAITVGGSWTVNGGTFVKGTSTVTMSATAPSLDFDGDNDNVNLGNITELNSVANFTMSTWVKEDVVPPPTDDYIFSKSVDSTNRILLYTSSNSNRLFCYFGNVSNSYAYLVNYNNYITAGRWHHISLVYDGAGATDADKLKLYIDGAYIAFDAFVGSIPVTTGDLSTATASISKATYAWDGNIQDFRIYSASLSAANITTLYQTGGYTTGMVHRYLLREGSGATANDTGSNVMNGTVSGATWGYGGKTIKSNGQAFNDLIFNGTGGSWTLQDDLTATNLTSTLGTLVDNGKTVTVNGNISIANTASLLTSTGTWVQGASGNISNASSGNRIRNLTIAGPGVASTLTDNVYVGAISGTNVGLMIGSGTLNGANNTIIFYNNSTTDSLTVNNPTIGSSLNALSYYNYANQTITNLTFPDNLVSGYFWIRTMSDIANVTAGGNWNLGNNSIRVSSNNTDATEAVSYVDMATHNLSTTGVLSVGLTTYNAYLKLGSGTHLIGGDFTGGSTATANKLEMGSAIVSVGGNLDFTHVAVTSGTSTVTMNAGDTGNTITSAGAHFNNLAFNNAAGGWTISDDLQVDGNMLLTSGILDNATNDKNVNVAGNVTMDNIQTDMGDGTWTVSGDFDNKDVTTFNRNASTVVLDGTNKELITKTTNIFHKLTISGTITLSVLTSGNYGMVNDECSVSGTLTIAAGKTLSTGTVAASNISVSATGKITGDGTLSINNHGSIDQQDGVIDVNTLSIGLSHAGATEKIIPATYDSANIYFLTSSNRSLYLESGTYILNGNVSFYTTSTGNYTINNSINNPNLIIKGNVSISENSGTVVNWIKGSGTITLSGAGSGTQTIDFLGKSVEDIIINDAGAVKNIADQFTTDSITIQAGTLDNTGNYDIAITGDLTSTGAGVKSILMGSAIWTVGGNIDFTGINVTPGTSTVTMNAGDTGNTITSAGGHFNNIAFDNVAGGWAFQDQTYIDGNLTVTNSEAAGNGVNLNNQAVDINGNVQIDGGKLSTGSSNIAVAGNWTRNGGTFVANTSGVTFDGGGAQAVTSGGQSFNNLTITNASAAGTTFADGATVAGTFTNITPSSKITFNDGSTYDLNAINLNGADAATRISLLSSNPGTQWFLNITDAAPSASFVSVQDSDASGGSQIDATTGGLNLGNNPNWLFGVASVAVTPNSVTLDQGATQTFTATAYDSSSIVIPSTVFDWSVVNGGGTINNAGLFTAGTSAGSFAGTVKATASGVNGLATVTVNELSITPATSGVGGEIELKKTPILPTETASETTKKKEDITLNDFQFYVALESGNLPLDITDEKNIETIINSNILVEISADLFAKKVNVITISNSGSTYLMNLLPDKNKYQAVIPMPAVKGDFELRILLVYEDGTIKEIKKTITVDPQGYVYTQSSNYFGLGKKQEVRIADAKVTLYKVNGGESTVWDSGGKEPNPVATNQSGEYAFWVPNGNYYLQIEKAGYKNIKTANFTVNNSLVVKNIEIEPKVKPWLWLIVISVVLAFGAYLLIRRRKKLKPIRGIK